MVSVSADNPLNKMLKGSNTIKGLVNLAGLRTHIAVREISLVTGDVNGADGIALPADFLKTVRKPFLVIPADNSTGYTVAYDYATNHVKLYSDGSQYVTTPIPAALNGSKIRFLVFAKE